MWTSAVLLVPLLPLLATLLVVAGGGAAVRRRVKIAVWPIGAACGGAIATLYVVATQGPITVRFYDPALAGSLPVPLGFYVDRLSAVMMVLISAIGTIIYAYSIEYMHQEPHERRYFALLGIAICVLLCMVASGNLMMLFLFWQILSYLLYLLIHNHTHAATLDSAFRTFTLLRTGDVAFLAGTALAYGLYGTLEFPDLFSA
ncbi:MAG TPA: proton-conducting transporter membrane subunit, partial [Nitrospira sp.]|nr:proton-conducting transporter membrane subunit [Nitrospira sp.]